MASTQPAQAQSAAPGRFQALLTPRNIDIAVVVGCLLAAVLFFMGRWQGIEPFAFLDGDGANVSSFATARADAAAFGSDPLLGDPEATRFYVNFHTVWTGIVGKAVSDFGLAYVMLLGPLVFLYLTLFYALGRTLFDNRLGAILLALLAAVTVRLPLAEYWGLFPDPQPRALFSALLPLPLIMAIRWRDKPQLWPLPLAFLGLLTYVHPVSAPPVAGALWLGLATFYNPERGLLKHVISLALAAGAFFLLMIPFAMLYFGSVAPPTDPAMNAAALAVIEQRFSPGFLDVPYAVWLFIESWFGLRAVLPIATAVSAWFLWTRRPQTRRVLIFFAAMAVGLILCGYVLPALEQVAVAVLDRLPKIVDFMRASRYLVMLMLIVAVWGAAEAAQGRRGLIALAIACLILPLAWIVIGKSAVIRPPLRLAGCLLQGRLLCGPTPAEADRLAMLSYIRTRTPADAAFVSLAAGDNAIDVRYAGKRAVAFSWKDGGAFGYANPLKLIDWSKGWARIKALEGHESDWPAASVFATSVKADYVILDAADAGQVPAPAVCHRGGTYVLASVSGACP